MTSFKLIFLRHVFIMILGGSYLLGSGFFILMFIPPFPLIAWILFPLVLINVISKLLSLLIFVPVCYSDNIFNVSLLLIIVIIIIITFIMHLATKLERIALHGSFTCILVSIIIIIYFVI